MFFKDLDFLSPKISIYYKGSLSHSSLFSIILSIISSIIIITFSIYFSLDLIQRKNPDFYYLNRYVEDAGEFPLNSSSLFHFISMGSIAQHIRGVDFRSFRIIGFSDYHENMEDKNIKLIDHWIYGFCDENDSKGINDLIEVEEYKKSACIKKYYNSLKKEYYDAKNINFKWPILSHGNFNLNVKSYHIVIDKCNQETLELIFGKNYTCKNDSEMDIYFSGNYGSRLYFIDEYIDVSNYKEPNKKFIYRIENTFSKEIYSANNLNFNPSMIKTHNGIIFDNIEEKLSYSFDRNDVLTYSTDSNNVYILYYFWLKNRLLIYERIYKRIQDIISIIGGIVGFVTSLSSFVNCFYHDYMILYDTKTLLFSSIEECEKKIQKSINVKNNINKENVASDILISSNNQQNLQSTKSLTNVRKTIDKKKLSIINDNENENENENKNKNRNKSNNKLKSYFNNNNSTDYIISQKTKNDKINNEYQSTNKLNIIKGDENGRKGNDSDIIDLNMKNSNFNYLDYLYQKIKCGKAKKNIEIYNNFRAKILSEEYFVHNNLNIQLLLRINEYNLMNSRDKYLLTNLVNIV